MIDKCVNCGVTLGDGEGYSGLCGMCQRKVYQKRLQLQPISYPEACAFISQYHRHHLPPQGWKFGIAVNDGEKVVGVVTVGRPVARMLDDGWTLEVTRSCTDGTKNVNSKLYGAATRATFALGYKRLITYTLDTEPGTSLLASNWRLVGEAGGGSWSRSSRPRVSRNIGQKLLWESVLEEHEQISD